MSKWNNIKIDNFLHERVGIYKPNNLKVKNLKRLQKIDFAGNIHFIDKKSKTNMIIIKQGDLVISGINVSKGALAVYEGKEDITATIHYSSYTYNKSKISIDFLKFFLKSPKFIQLLKNQIKGGIKTEIKPKHILPLEVKLPDKSEQEKIVNFFNNIEKSSVDLNNEIINQQSLIKLLRQTILQEAVEGKITADWRRKHPGLISGENSAKNVLKKIKIEKEQLIKEKKIKKQKPLPPISEEEELFKIPNTWVYSRLGDLGFINPRNYINNNLIISFVPMKSISEKYGVSPDYEEKIWNEVKSGYTHFANKDIAIAKITPCFENSKCCIFRNLRNGYGAGTTELHVLRPIRNIVNSEYVYLFLKAPRFLKKGKSLMKGTAGQKRVPLNYFSESLIPLPPIPEQQVIVNRVSNFMNIVDELEKQINTREEQTARLVQSVLREAFAQK